MSTDWADTLPDTVETVRWEDVRLTTRKNKRNKTDLYMTKAHADSHIHFYEGYDGAKGMVLKNLNRKGCPDYHVQVDTMKFLSILAPAFARLFSVEIEKIPASDIVVGNYKALILHQPKVRAFQRNKKEADLDLEMGITQMPLAAVDLYVPAMGVLLDESGREIGMIMVRNGEAYIIPFTAFETMAEDLEQTFAAHGFTQSA